MDTAAEDGSRSKRLWILLALAPLVWMAQGTVGWYLTGRACPADARPISLDIARALIVAITLAALACTVGALVSAGRTLRSLSAPAGPQTASRPLTERSRFLAVVGMLVGVTLTLGLVFAGLPAAIFHACGEAR
jgi:hypothetical protein